VQALIAATGSLDASASAGGTDHLAISDVFCAGSVAQAQAAIFIASAAWLVFVGVAIRQA
jgi:hypothetical protein